MGNRISDKSAEARFNELGLQKAPEAITSAENASNFEASYKEPVFSVGQDGRLQGGDEGAMKIFMQKFANKEEEKVTTEATDVVEESSVIANMAFAEVDPTCCQ